MGIDVIALCAWVMFFSLAYRKFADPKLYFLVNLLGSWLFLPQTTIDLPALPDLNKETAFAFSALFAAMLFERREQYRFTPMKLDWPVLAICLVPIFTSLDNDLGFWDGLSSSIGNSLVWGVPYYLGRRYFRSIADLKYLLTGFVAAAVLYLPFVWFEVFMSPNLHKTVYGYNQGDWLENLRYGGYRPKVFMKHGLMVAFFVSVSVIAAAALIRLGTTIRIARLKPAVIDKIMMVTVVACKSGNGIFFLVLGLVARILGNTRLARLLLLSLILVIPSYLYVRISGAWEWRDMIAKVEMVSDATRAGSLNIRLETEELFMQRAKQKWLLGWGGWGRAFPVNEKGIRLTRGVDSLWIIVYSEHGALSLASLCWIMLAAPFLVVRRLRSLPFEKREKSFLLLASSIPVFFMVDCLVNAMVSPFYPMLAGALMTTVITANESQREDVS